ncbi:MAG: OstA-like protein [Odoribacter sp.]
MRIKALLIIACLLSVCLQTTAQNKAVIQIKHSDTGTQDFKKNISKLFGNVSLEHNNMLMSCDSLYNYPDSNFVEAFGNVHVIQNDTLNLWGDYMTYSGISQMAKVRDHVIMQDPQITLTTNFLDYDAGQRIGYYFNKGTIKDSVNTLISDEGYYHVALSEMFFKDSVKVYTPDYTMFSDTMKYKTDTKIITILGPTYIYGDKRTLYSENGWYNSMTSHAELYKNNRITYTDYWGRADTMVIDSMTNTAIMRQNIHLYDTVNNVIIEGNYGEIQKSNDSAYVTQRALLIMAGKTDSLFVHGDTLFMTKDSIGNNVMKCYFNTKFFSTDLQGLCDSMVFPVADSTIYLYTAPIVWAGGNQMTATTIDMHLRNNQVDEFHLLNKALIINQLDTVMFNQIKGRNMTGYVTNNELTKVYVNGNGEVLYYTDDKGVIFGLNKTICSNMNIYLTQKRVKKIVFLTKPEGKLNPLFKVTKEDRYLKDFQWHINQKPLKKEDIFKK